MSLFHDEDLVALKADSSVRGIVHATWSDIEEEEYMAKPRFLYFHKDQPRAPRKAWLQDQHLLPGFVIIDFAQEVDGACFIAEDELFLLDRALTPGDTVKLNSSDALSGTVMSQSVECVLEPTVLVEDLIRQEPFQCVEYCPNHEAFQQPQTTAQRSRNLTVSAQGLKHWNDYKEEDFIIYRDWLGLVQCMTEEVTIRLSNGSVVVVESVDELEVPFYVPGSQSLSLVQKLHRLGFVRHAFKTSASSLNTMPIDYCYPGLFVQTKKGNLRRGSWKFGAYDPNIAPQGVVVDVRIVELNISWLSSGFASDQSSPPVILNSDILNSGEVKVVDRGGLPQQPLAPTLQQATWASQFCFGHHVRFKDPASAAVKQSPEFERIPRTASSGFDMNVFEITSTRTNILVRWQDGSVSEHDSNTLVPMIDLTKYEAWPGRKVSFKPEETSREMNGDKYILAKMIGVIQTVNPAERLATVRWFDGARMDLDAFSRDWYTASSGYGTIGERITEVPLYDLGLYTAFDPFIGDLALIVPEAQSSHDLEYRFGEVVDLCLDGDVLIRAGPSEDKRDIKAAMHKIIVVPTEALEDFGSDSNGLETADSVIDMEVDDDEDEPAEVEIEYDDGRKEYGEEEDEDAWSTEDGEEHDLTSTNGESTEERSLSEDSPAAFSILDDLTPADHHFIGEESSLLPDQLKRILKEHKILKSSLPDGIFVRAWESRLDLLRVLFIGPSGTPYEFAPFFFDMHFSTGFPMSPPDTHFHSWTNNSGRINPNLYEDGKVCLSLLGTWPADESNESWSPIKSTVLQILVSLMGLVLVKEPYYNEAGFDVLTGSEAYRINSNFYSETSYILAKGFVKRVLENCPSGFHEIIQFLYLAKPGPRLLKRVMADCRKLDEGAAEGKGDGHLEWLGPGAKLSKGAVIMLQRNMEWMRKYAGTRPWLVSSEELQRKG